MNAASLTPEQVGAIAGGALAGIAGMATIVGWGLKNFVGKSRGKSGSSNSDSIGRDEFNLFATTVSTELKAIRDEVKEARAEASAAHSSVATIAQVIDSSMRALGDRLEGALREVKEKQDDHGEKLDTVGNRVTAIETEIDVTAGRPPRHSK